MGRVVSGMRPLLVLLVVLSTAHLAHAMCGSPSPGLSPVSGPLPPHPQIYVFVPEHGMAPKDLVEVQATRYGAAVPFTSEQVATSPAYDVYRLTIDIGADDGPISVKLADGGTSRYEIVASPPANRAEVTGVTHVSDHWTCSFTETIRFALDGNAIAYRLVWDDRTTTVLPADGGVMWPGAGDSQRTQAVRTTAELGHLDCMGSNVEDKLLDTPRGFALYAEFADGSTQRLGESTAQLGDHGVRLPTELVGRAVGARTAGMVLPTVLTSRVDVVTPWWAVGAGGLGGLAALLGGAILTRRRRVHAPRA